MNGDTGESYVPSPRPNPRLRPEGESFEARNRQGCGERWYDYTKPESEEEKEIFNHADRMPSEEARQNAEMNKGSMKDIMGGYCDPPEQRSIHPRAVTNASSDTAQANKGHNLRHLLDDYGRCTPEPPPVAKLKGDLANEYAERNKGTAENVINNYGVQTPTDDEVKEKMDHISRVKKEDTMGGIIKMEPELYRAESKGMGRLHEESQECWDELPPQRHCRPEGEEISRHMNNCMADIMSMKGCDEPKRVVKEVPPHLQEAVTPRPPTATRVRPEGQLNFERDHSSVMMNAIFGKDANDVTPRQVKVNRMMMRSEEW